MQLLEQEWYYMEFLCYHQRNYFHKWQRGHIALFTLAQNETSSRNDQGSWIKGQQSISTSYTTQCKKPELLTSICCPTSSVLIEREENVVFANCPQNPRARRIFTSQTVKSAFNFSGLRVPVPCLSQKPYVISPQTPCAKGSSMIQVSVWVAIWASPVHTSWWEEQMIRVYMWEAFSQWRASGNVNEQRALQQYTTSYLKMNQTNDNCKCIAKNIDS